jgi:polysaccharide deacetylase 2 family uncharacterized protein YibQ
MPSDQKSPSKASILGVNPILATVAAFALLFAGVMFGAWLNVTSKPVVSASHPLPKYTPKPSKAVPRPVIENADKLEDEPAPLFGPDLPPRYVAPGKSEPPPSLRTDPMVAYAVASTVPKSVPVIAVVIDDMGLDRVNGQHMVDLPAPLTLSFLTYADNLATWVTKAREAGHEVMAHVPMEPLDRRENPGPKALTVSLSQDEVDKRMASLLDNWSGYVGINNHMGSKFTADKERMAVVIEALKARGLLWLDSKTTGSSVGADLARAAGVPSVERDVFLDNVQSEANVRKELAAAEEIARRRGTAIAIGHPHKVTVAVLKQWLATLPEKGIAVVPLTEVARRQGQLR